MLSLRIQACGDGHARRLLYVTDGVAGIRRNAQGRVGVYAPDGTRISDAASAAASWGW